MPMTNSHSVHVSPAPALDALHADPLSAALGTVAIVAGTVAARRRSRVTPVDDARLVARASVAGRSASDQRRLEMFTQSH